MLYQGWHLRKASLPITQRTDPSGGTPTQETTEGRDEGLGGRQR